MIPVCARVSRGGGCGWAFASALMVLFVVFTCEPVGLVPGEGTVCVSPRVTWEAAQRLRHLFRPHVIWGSVSTLQRSECQGVDRKSIRQPGLGNCGICHTGRCKSCRSELKSLQYATFLGFLNAQWDGQSCFPASFRFPLDALPLPNVVPFLACPLPLESPLRVFVHCGCHGVVRGLEAAWPSLCLWSASS